LTLSELPERGRVVPEISDPAVREIVHRPYRIIYEIFPDRNAVYILRFWHGARGEPEISGQK
jgi:plasmid stabilization system protein ParE